MWNRPAHRTNTTKASSGLAGCGVIASGSHPAARPRSTDQAAGLSTGPGQCAGGHHRSAGGTGAGALLIPNSTNQAITTAVNAVPISDLLKDPFLTTDSDQTQPERPNQVTAMPWLASPEEPRPTPTTTPTPNPARTPEPTVTPKAVEAMARPTAQPESRSEQPPKEQPPRNAEEPTPPNNTPEPTAPETAPEDLLKTSWLRVQLKPKPASPTDATKPMGLINRIKQSFARFAGR